MGAATAKARHQDTPLWEWAIAAVGFILVVGALCTAILRAAREEATAPILPVTVDSVSKTGDGYVVTFSVANAGTQTAAAVVVEGTLLLDGRSVEESTVTLTYVPANSKREGGMFFSEDPASHKLELKARGFEKP